MLWFFRETLNYQINDMNILMMEFREWKERYEKGVEISLREFLYPIMQGYDSYEIEADIEIGGFDQLFNVKAGRDIQNFYGKKKQNIITLSMLEGTDGRKMSTSWGNIITIVDEPYDMFGKVMSLRDDLITKYMYLCTDSTEEEIKEVFDKADTNDDGFIDEEAQVGMYVHGIAACSLYVSVEQALRFDTTLADTGFNYGFTLDNEKNDDDFEFPAGTTSLLIDGLSAPYIEGATIDYINDLTGSNFKITNPNASRTCGCGSSFGV